MSGFARAGIVVALLTSVFAAVRTCPAGADNKPSQGDPSGGGRTHERDVQAIQAQVEKYTRSIGQADTTLAAEVWANTPEVSFIHPRGHERGWEQVKENFYGKTMGATFSRRDLRIVSDVPVTLYGDAAWTEFYWDFNATVKKDGSKAHTKGRETQIYHRDSIGWRLVHVHYSSMPVTGEGQGF